MNSHLKNPAERRHFHPAVKKMTTPVGAAAEIGEAPVPEGSEGWKNADFLSLEESENDREEEPLRIEANNKPRQDPPLGQDTAQQVPWMDQSSFIVNLRTNPLVALHNEIVDFCRLMEPLPEEMKQREQLVKRITKLTHSVFGADKCRVVVFGSQATGLCLPTSDIDLVVHFVKEQENKKSKEQEEEEEEEMDSWDDTLVGSPLTQLAHALREKWQGELSYLEAIENTRIPIVKFIHEPTNISVDVCFDQDTGPKAAELMKTYMQALPPLRPLTFVLKYFMDARGINEPYTGGVGSFMLQLMIVSFLQHRERDGYNFDRPSLANLGCLLVEFLELYGLDFNYSTTGISVRHDGYYFPKGDKNRIENFWNPARPFSLALENPLEPSADVGRATYRMNVVQRSFEVAFKVLLAHVSQPVVPAVSKLASILPPTPEMMQRATLKRVDKTLSTSLASSRPSQQKHKRHQNSRKHSSDMETSSGEDAPPKRKRTKF